MRCGPARASATSKGRRTSIPERWAGSTRAGWPLIWRLVDLVAFHDLLHFLKPPWTQRGRHQRHGGGTLSAIHVFQADTTAGNHGNWKVRPTRALTRVVEREHDSLPLLRIQRGKELVSGAHDSSVLVLVVDRRGRWGGCQRQARQRECTQSKDGSYPERLHHFSFHLFVSV
jgi:hypothetical protein